MRAPWRSRDCDVAALAFSLAVHALVLGALVHYGPLPGKSRLFAPLVLKFEQPAKGGAAPGSGGERGQPYGGSGGDGATRGPVAPPEPPSLKSPQAVSTPAPAPSVKPVRAVPTPPPVVRVPPRPTPVPRRHRREHKERRASPRPPPPVVRARLPHLSAPPLPARRAVGRGAADPPGSGFGPARGPGAGVGRGGRGGSGSVGPGGSPGGRGRGGTGEGAGLSPRGPTNGPSLVSFSQPPYPSGARARKEQGRVLLSVRVGADGRVEAVSVARSSGSGELDGAAARAAERARFKPARRDGVSVAATKTISVVFRLDRAW